jgi:hypothetical protein
MLGGVEGSELSKTGVPSEDSHPVKGVRHMVDKSSELVHSSGQTGEII